MKIEKRTDLLLSFPKTIFLILMLLVTDIHIIIVFLVCVIHIPMMCKHIALVSCDMSFNFALNTIFNFVYFAELVISLQNGQLSCP